MEKIRPKKTLGQNFLTNKEIIFKIIESLDLKKDDFVFEIGPGTGALTSEIIKHVDNYLGCELDTNLSKLLEEKLKIKILNQDILKFDLNTLKNKNLKIVGNLPYYITGDILIKMFKFHKFDSFSFMVQKEVGERIISKTDSKKYNSLSVIVSLFYDVKTHILVPASAFYPAPKVVSMFLSLVPKKSDYTPDFIGNFLKFLQICFFNRRKVFLSNLKKNFPQKEKMFDEFFNKNKLNIKARVENITPEMLLSLFKKVYEDISKN